LTNGKGDKQRPRLISRDDYERNWDTVFGRGARERDKKSTTTRNARSKATRKG
jgi:hypothetical protein